MDKKLQLAFEWLEHTHETVKALAADNRKFSSDYMQGYAAGQESAIRQYEKEIANIRQLIDGYLVEDVDLSGSEEIA